MNAIARPAPLAGAIPRLRVMAPQPAGPASAWAGPRLALAAAALAAAGFAAGFSFSVTALTVLGFAAALAGIRSPAAGLVGVGLLSTIDPLTRVYLMSGGIFRWNTFNYVLLLMLAIYYQRVLRFRDRSSLLLAGFLFLMVAHLAFTPALDVGLYNCLNVTAAFGLLLYHLRCGRDDQALYWCAVTNGLTAGIGGMVYFAQLNSLPLINKNAWSAFPLTALFSICLAFPSEKAGWRGRLGLGLLALVNTLWIFFSGSRGAMLIAIFCLIFLLADVKGVQQKIFAGVVAVIGTLVVFAAFGEQQEFALHRVEKLFDTSRALDSRTSGRSDLVIAGWRIFRENPFGVGTGGFGPAYATLVDHDIGFTGHEKGAHSAWVKTLAENGVLGTLVLAAYVGSFAVLGWRRRRMGFFPLGLLVTLVIGSAFFSREFQSKGLWLMAAGFLAVAEYGALSGARAAGVVRGGTVRRGTPRRYPVAPPAGSF